MNKIKLFGKERSDTEVSTMILSVGLMIATLKKHDSRTAEVLANWSQSWMIEALASLDMKQAKRIRILNNKLTLEMGIKNGDKS